MNLYWGEVGSVLQGGWAPSSNLRSTWGFGWWWYTPAGVVASVAACVPIVSRYNERCGVSHTTGQRRNSLFTLCVLTQQLSPHRTASHRAAPRCTAPHRIHPTRTQHRHVASSTSRIASHHDTEMLVVGNTLLGVCCSEVRRCKSKSLSSKRIRLRLLFKF